MNEKFNFAYLSSCSTSEDDAPNDLMSKLYNDHSLHFPVCSSYVAKRQSIESSQAVFVVPARDNYQKDIIFGLIDHLLCTLWDESEDEYLVPQFLQYNQITKRMMSDMGYDFTRPEGLNYG